MKVLMLPHLNSFGKEQSGIRRVVEAYFKYLPDYDVELVHPDATNYDLKAVHAGATGGDCDVSHCHGLYFTADYPDASRWEYEVNVKVIDSLRCAKAVTVPSDWVAQTLRRDMHLDPVILPHGIDWREWEHNSPIGDHILWNKNRVGDVCSPRSVYELAKRFPDKKFMMTFADRQHPLEPNMQVLGLVPHSDMKNLLQTALVYLSTTKETFGIGTLEAMASGTPVLGFAVGGNLELVAHKVTGYLAAPGDYEDLADGLLYCIEHRAKMSEASRELIKDFGWDSTINKLAKLYQDVARGEPPTVAVVIPSFNYADRVENALESAIGQSYGQLTDIVVVDDGSQDGTKDVVAGYLEKDSRIRYIYQDNAGVAHARNRGIASVGTKYVCCLDADDRIAPLFIERCIGALEADNSLGVAYTGLSYFKPDGTSGLSPWPTEFDYGAHLTGKAQIPTCCVFRRSMWERLGGYRQRYAPGGAGEEDAEFWLRAGANGFNAKKVTSEGLFLYSWQSGRVSGNKSHAVSDWRGWHSWVKNGKNVPFAALIPAKTFSHPVRQYDQPIVSVVIPVGPRHANMRTLVNALDSLEAQIFHRWEVVLAWDTDEDSELEAVLKAYPYASVVRSGGLGAGVARNIGASAINAQSEYLVFLDADDWLLPAALEEMVKVFNETGAIAYTDYVGRATVENPEALSEQQRKQLYSYNPKNHEAVIGFRAAEYDCEKAIRQPEGNPPYVWCNVTSLIPVGWFDEIGGFDESMKSWEDWDLHIRLARAGRCYRRVPKELMVYDFTTGNRREDGLVARGDLLEYLRGKYAKDGIMARCGSCGGSRRAQAPSLPVGVPAAEPARAVISDGDFVLCRYSNPNVGDHTVVGPHGFPEKLLGGVPMVPRSDSGRKLWYINYGYRAGGDRFLVHRQDLAGGPNMFVPE